MNFLEKIKKIEAPLESFEQKAHDHIMNLTMPPYALGDLLDIGIKLSGIYRQMPPKITHKKAFIFAADHGITEEKVSLFPKDVTSQMVYNFANNGAAINVLSRHANIDTYFVDVGVDHDFSSLANHPKFLGFKIDRGTKNFYHENAMTYEQAIQSLEVGFNLVEKYHETTDLFAIGEMGIGNTTTAAAMSAALTQASVANVTGPGTGVDEKGIAYKVEIITESLHRRKIDNQTGPIKILERIGGFEIGAMTGMCLGCALFKKAVIIDGLISTTSALLANKINALSSKYMFLAHKSKEPGHQVLFHSLGLKPILDLNLRLGEGSGTPLALPIIEASAKILSEMATFEDASVSRQKN